MIRNLIKHIPGTRKTYQATLNIAKTPKKISDYLQRDGEKKLHIGCGHNTLTGWLNSDYYPTQADVIHLDATKQFPLPSNSFDYVFSEHMIEHVNYNDGLKMLRESHRIMKPGGKIRISTPDLKFLIELYTDSKTQLQADYIKWAGETFTKTEEKTDTIVINNFVRDWGHLFIYDKKTLSRSLEVSGFVKVEYFDINKSNDTALVNLENTSRMPIGFLQLESLTLEATKP
jgi:predicted SAM-dependent methyltransferase